MPKRWRITSGSKWGYQLLDKHGEVLFESNHVWDDPDAVDAELDEITKGDIEFPDHKEKGPKHHRKGEKA